jgi:hypothetical protein
VFLCLENHRRIAAEIRSRQSPGNVRSKQEEGLPRRDSILQEMYPSARRVSCALIPNLAYLLVRMSMYGRIVVYTCYTSPCLVLALSIDCFIVLLASCKIAGPCDTIILKRDEYNFYMCKSTQRRALLLLGWTWRNLYSMWNTKVRHFCLWQVPWQLHCMMNALPFSVGS